MSARNKYQVYFLVSILMYHSHCNFIYLKYKLGKKRGAHSASYHVTDLFYSFSVGHFPSSSRKNRFITRHAALRTNDHNLSVIIVGPLSLVYSTNTRVNSVKIRIRRSVIPFEWWDPTPQKVRLWVLSNISRRKSLSA